MDLYPFLEKMLDEAEDPLYLAVKLAILGNSLDFMVADSSLAVESTITDRVKASLPDYVYLQFKQRLETCSHLVYFGDNAGEIVFDKLLIETIQKIYNFLYKPFNKVWSSDGRELYYDTSALYTLLQPVLAGFRIWSTTPPTIRDLATPRPAAFWNYPYISSADDEKIWVYQAEWDPVKSGFILNVKVDSTASITFSNFGSAPSAYSGGSILSNLTPSGGNYTLTLTPGDYNLVIL